MHKDMIKQKTNLDLAGRDVFQKNFARGRRGTIVIRKEGGQLQQGEPAGVSRVMQIQGFFVCFLVLF